MAILKRDNVERIVDEETAKRLLADGWQEVEVKETKRKSKKQEDAE